MGQLSLFGAGEHKADLIDASFPTTRYQGSKRKLLGWLWESLSHLPFDTALDVFGGTGSVSYLFKRAGKHVTYNDALKFNWNTGLALIQNSNTRLEIADVERILGTLRGQSYPNFIQTMFPDIYFTAEENAWLDRVIFNIGTCLTDPYKRALARYALFQACIIKRPYNLFHRANLYMRTAQVDRSFGNKTTWDTPFEAHFRTFVNEANRAIFDNGRPNSATCLDALETPQGHDLVYLDPPYLNKKGIGVDYRDFYHFLEGIMMYETWSEQIDLRSRHKRLHPQASPWLQTSSIHAVFEALIARHQESIIVISYRDDGIPDVSQLRAMLAKYKSHVTEARLSQQYALSPSRSHEVLLIGQ